MTILSKSLFLEGLNCPTQLHKSSRQVKEPYKANYLIDQYKNVVKNIIAPQGISMKGEILSIEEKDSICITYYNARIIDSLNNISVTPDIIEIDHANNTVVTLIKPATKIIDINYYEAAFAWFCLKRKGFKSIKVQIAYVNKDFTLDDKIDKSLIRIEEVTKYCSAMQGQVQNKIEYFNKVIRSQESPEPQAGYQCFNPVCQFKDQCWKEMPVNNVFELRFMRTSTKLKLYYKDIVSFEELSRSGHNFTSNQQIQLTAALSQKIIIQKELINEWLKCISGHKSILYFDIETFASIIPIAKGQKPYARIPFQFSLGVYDVKKDRYTKMAYLAEPHLKLDTRREFTAHLLRFIINYDHVAPIVVWNKTFELSVLKELKTALNDDEAIIGSLIDNISDRIVDLMEIFKEMLYYDPRFQGSYSIKKVLPVLVPELSYESLPVKNGEVASNMYLAMLTQDESTRKITRGQLLEYCNLDSYAMHRILMFLQNLD